VITHRLIIRYFHQTAVEQTVAWLDGHGVPYWDLCFMRDKGAVGADLYVEDSPINIEKLRAQGCQVLIIDNGTNRGVADDPGGRAQNWTEAEAMIRERYYEWLDERHMARPPAHGVEPKWAAAGPKPVV
jgi:5'(3')-deoxyribonucleotidase